MRTAGFDGIDVQFRHTNAPQVTTGDLFPVGKLNKTAITRPNLRHDFGQIFPLGYIFPLDFPLFRVSSLRDRQCCHDLLH